MLNSSHLQSFQIRLTHKHEKLATFSTQPFCLLSVSEMYVEGTCRNQAEVELNQPSCSSRTTLFNKSCLLLLESNPAKGKDFNKLSRSQELGTWNVAVIGNRKRIPTS